jgi:hypothetical protein
MKLYHLSTDQPSTFMCRKPPTPGDLLTYETPRSEKDWSKVCRDCRKQYEIVYEASIKKRQEEQANKPPPTFRERLARFAHADEDPMGIVGVMFLHISTLGLSAIAMKIAKRYLSWSEKKPSKSENAPSKKEKQIKADRDAPNLYAGKIISDRNLEYEVISIEPDMNNMTVKVMRIDWDVLGRYLDVGNTYPVFKHKSEYFTEEKGMVIWEVEPTSMKRDVSQILLAWEKDIGWSWEVDS